MYDNFNSSTRQMLADMVLGVRVDTGTITIPHTTSTVYYHIHGGKVLVTGLVGEMTTAADGANSIHIDHTPTTGTASVIGAAADIDSWAIGDIISLLGLYSDVILPAVAAGTTPMLAYKGVVMTPGTLGWQSSGTTAGDWKWTIFYIPLDDGAYIEAIV
jgi:hypothetical protein